MTTTAKDILKGTETLPDWITRNAKFLIIAAGIIIIIVILRRRK